MEAETFTGNMVTVNVLLKAYTKSSSSRQLV